jgi:hypothetical protein
MQHSFGGAFASLLNHILLDHTTRLGVLQTQDFELVDHRDACNVCIWPYRVMHNQHATFVLVECLVFVCQFLLNNINELCHVLYRHSAMNVVRKIYLHTLSYSGTITIASHVDAHVLAALLNSMQA